MNVAARGYLKTLILRLLYIEALEARYGALNTGQTFERDALRWAIPELGAAHPSELAAAEGDAEDFHAHRATRYR